MVIRLLAAILNYHVQSLVYLNSEIHYQESYQYHCGHRLFHCHNEQFESESIEVD